MMEDGHLIKDVDMDDDLTICIFAGSIKQAEDWERRHFISKYKRVLYITRPEQLRGLRNILFLKCGTYYENRYEKEIFDIAEYLINRDKKD